MRKYLGFVMGMIAGLYAVNARANSLTVRDIKLIGDGKVEVQLDGIPTKNSLDIEYVRDIVQFSIQNTTIYPAKILHADEKSAFSKVFAYQYAPNLVRVRFSVDGKADSLKDKVKWEQKGKILTIAFPESMPASAKKDGETDHERSLLSKVLGQSAHADVKVEKIEETPQPVAERAAAPAPKPETASGNTAEKLKLNGSGASVKKLGGAHEGPSMIRSFLAMILVVGGLGLVLLYIKKKKNVVQAKRVGDSWISNLLSGPKKHKALIEVVANHALGPKQSITVVKIRGQQLVLGVTEGNVQLITQLDSDEEIDVLDDPKIADSIGKIFGGKPKMEPMVAIAQTKAPAPKAADPVAASFSNLLKNSSGAGATIARNAYQSQGSHPQPAPRVDSNLATASVRDQIKQRLQGMRN